MTTTANDRRYVTWRLPDRQFSKVHLQRDAEQTICGRTLPRATGSPQPPIPAVAMCQECAASEAQPGLLPLMCGRFAQPRSADELARIFHARPATDLPGAQFNVAPTDEVAAVVEHHGERTVDAFRWGLVPFYSETSKAAARLINARAETVETTPAFRASFKSRRCILPADAFYEWRRTRDESTGRTLRSEPFAIRRRDGEPLAFAGLWAIWRNPETAERLYTCSIITTQANDLVARLHDRMPVLIERSDWDRWLSETTPLTGLRGLLHPAPAEKLDVYAVSPAVNNVRSEGPELLAPLSRWSDGL